MCEGRSDDVFSVLWRLARVRDRLRTPLAFFINIPRFLAISVYFSYRLHQGTGNTKSHTALQCFFTTQDRRARQFQISPPTHTTNSKHINDQTFKLQHAHLTTWYYIRLYVYGFTCTALLVLYQLLVQPRPPPHPLSHFPLSLARMVPPRPSNPAATTLPNPTLTLPPLLRCMPSF